MSFNDFYRAIGIALILIGFLCFCVGILFFSDREVGYGISYLAVSVLCGIVVKLIDEKLK